MRPTLSLDRFEVFAEGLDHPEGLAFDGDGNLWAGGELGQIYQIDSKRRIKLVTTLGGFNLGLTFSARQELYVCNFKLGALIHLDRSGKVLRSWERAGVAVGAAAGSVRGRRGEVEHAPAGGKGMGQAAPEQAGAEFPSVRGFAV